MPLLPPHLPTRQPMAAPRAGRRRLLGAAAALAAGALCPPARAFEVVAEYLRITHPWTRGTAPGASFGVLCMKLDEVLEDERLIGVRTPVADGVRLAGSAPDVPLDLAIPAGSLIEMHEQGLHLQLTGLRLDLEAGRSYPLELQFARSGVVRAVLSVDFPRFG
jgi:hypothetical protein